MTPTDYFIDPIGVVKYERKSIKYYGSGVLRALGSNARLSVE